MIVQSDDFLQIRRTWADLPAGAAASTSETPTLDLIFTPSSHVAAIDPERTLVIGNRGVGKTFWSNVLADTDARSLISRSYSRLKLDRVEAAFGYKGAVGDETAPPRDALGPAFATVPND